jgi:hypothetical protein
MKRLPGASGPRRVVRRLRGEQPASVLATACLLAAARACVGVAGRKAGEQRAGAHSYVPPGRPRVCVPGAPPTRHAVAAPLRRPHRRCVVRQLWDQVRAQADEQARSQGQPAPSMPCTVLGADRPGRHASGPHRYWECRRA